MGRVERWLCFGLVVVIGAVSGCKTTAPLTHREPHPDVAPAAPTHSDIVLAIDADPVEPMHSEILPIDLLTVVRVAAASNIEILQARNQLEAARGRVDSAVGQLFPTLSPTAIFEVVNGNVRATEGNILDVGFSTFRTFLAVDWILNPGRVYYEIVASKKHLAATEHQERAVVIQTIHDAVIEYYDLVLARSRIESAEQSLREANELLRINTLRAQAGTGLPADRLRSLAHLAERTQELTFEMNRFYHASVALALTLRLDSTVTLLPQVEQLPPITLVREDLTIDELLTIAVLYRPDLEQVRKLVEVAQADRSAAFWGGFGPTLGASYMIGGISGHDIDGASGLNHTSGFHTSQSASVGGSIRLSVSTLGNLRVADAVKQQAVLEAEAALDRVNAQVVNALQSSRTNAALMDSARAQIGYAQEALKLIELNLQAGTMTTLEVLDAEDSLSRARLRYARAVVGYNQSQVDLLAALGVLDQAALFPFERDGNRESPIQEIDNEPANQADDGE